jgi:hypothetical protein
MLILAAQESKVRGRSGMRCRVYVRAANQMSGQRINSKLEKKKEKEKAKKEGDEQIETETKGKEEKVKGRQQQRVKGE